MKHYLYLSLIPESLVISMLPPEEFGNYLAVGTEKRSHEQAMYFDLTDVFESDYFDFDKALSKCIRHDGGQPKHSVYVSIYRTLEHVPMDKINNLWLTTRDGRVLKLAQGQIPDKFPGKYHLYQELCPVHPLIASSLNPVDFCKDLTRREIGITVPKICFVELTLSDLAENPDADNLENLPYKDIEHLKSCLKELASQKKIIKTVNRIQPERVFYRCIKSGFFIGNAKKLIYFPFPSLEEIDKNNHDWYRSATLF